MDSIKITTQPYADAGSASGLASRGRAPAATSSTDVGQAGAPVEGQAQDIFAQASQKQIEEALAELKQTYGMTVEMTQDQASGRQVARIYSADGKHLIRQMPPEAVLHMADTLRSGGQGGLLGSHI